MTLGHATRRRFSITGPAGAAAALAAALSLSACGDHMVFAERAGFSLATINVGKDADRPLHVNMGVEHRVFTLAPPTHGVKETDDGGRRAEGDATSLISGFEMSYEPSDTFLPGRTSITTQFASGNAAVEVSEDQEAARTLMDARSRFAWFKAPAGASLGELQARIRALEAERGRLVGLRAGDDETVFEIASGKPPAQPIVLQPTDQATLTDAEKSDSLTGTALVDGEPRRVTAYREQSPPPR